MLQSGYKAGGGSKGIICAALNKHSPTPNSTAGNQHFIVKAIVVSQAGQINICLESLSEMHPWIHRSSRGLAGIVQSLFI